MKRILTVIAALVVLGTLQSQENPPTKSKTVEQVVYYGSSKSNKYHLPSCEWAKKIISSNRVAFKSPEEAKAKRYEPCGVCKPDLTRKPDIAK